MEACCNGATIVAYDSGGCSGYCEAVGQDVETLFECFDDPNKGPHSLREGISFLLCNGCPSSSTSSSTNPTQTASGTVPGTSSASATGAAAALRPAGGEGVSKMGLTIASVLVLGFVTGMAL